MSTCSCGAFVRASAEPCPSCGREARPAAPGHRTVAMALLGLALTGCPTTSVPLYGTPITDTSEPVGETADTGAE